MRARCLGTLAAATSIIACSGDAGRRDAAAAGSSEGPPAGSSSAVAAEAVPTGCDVLPRAEVERIAGPLVGEPEPEDRGCWYYVAMDTTTTEWKQVKAGADRARAGGMDERAIEMYHPTRAGLYVEVDVRGEGSASERGADTGTTTPPAGWDEVLPSRRGTAFYGRAGYLRVTLRQRQLSLPSDTLLALANRLRDRVPDGPIGHPAADPLPEAAAGKNPCSVLVPAEAEAVLGKLVVAPYRTKERTPLADPSGSSCAYHTAGHRVLVLTPEWEYGRTSLEAARMVGGMVRQVADLPGIEGDTLEGPWDDAVVDLSGELLLLKKPHALGIRYLMSSTDAAGAIRLAAPALRRLAATPEPERLRVASDGCLPESRVGEIVESPARLVFNAAGMCNYTLKDDPTVQIELAVRPAQGADEFFAEMRQRANMVSRQTPEKLGVGEVGWAWGGTSQAEAAARGGGKLYHARMHLGLNTSIPNRRDAMVQLVTEMMQ